MMCVIAGLVIWCIISVWFFLSTMGYKHRKDKWYDLPLLAPVLVMFTIAGWISTIFGWNK